MDNRRKKGCSLFSRIHSTTQQKMYLFIYPPDAILVCRIPGEENALSHSLYLLVSEWCWCVRAGQRWRMGNWSLVNGCQGNLDIHTCFSRFELRESIKQGLVAIREYDCLPRRLRRRLYRQTPQWCVFLWLYKIIDSYTHVGVVNPGEFVDVFSPACEQWQQSHAD